MHRVTQKSYTQLLVTEQEYAIWLALHVLERNTWCKSLIFKSAQLALKVLTNLTLYLQQQELITDEERMSWQRCEKLLCLILLFIHKAQPLVPIECPSFLEASFPAYFISSVPEDFTMAYIEASLPSSNFDLFDETYSAVKIFLNYILQVLRQTPYPTPLVSTLLSLLSTCPRLNETELFVTVLESFRSWSSESNDFIHSAKLTILFSKINVSNSLISQKQIFQMLSHMLELNENYVREKNLELLPEDVLIDACSVIVEHLSSIQEQPKQPQNVNISGFGKEKFEEDENNNEEFCSFNRTGTNYEMQHWYYCYTCKLVANRGTCSVCARKCHKGHEIVYSRRGNFFCDCGANQGNNSCKSMPKGVKRRNINTRLLNREDLDLGIGMGTSLEFREFLDRGEYFNEGHRSLLIPSQPLQGSMINFEEYSPDIHDMPEFSISSPALDLPSDDDPSGSEDKKDFDEIDEEEDDDDEDEEKDDLMGEMDIEDSESEFKQSSKSSVEVKKQKNEIVVQPRHINLEPGTYFGLLEIVKRTLVRIGDVREPWGNFFGKKVVETSRTLSKHLCNFKAFSSLKSSYSEHKELKEVSAKYPGNRNSLAYCPDQNLILMAEGNKLLSIDSSLFQTNSTEVDRSNIQYLCKHVFSFQIMNVVRNPDNSRLLAVTGISNLSCILLCSKQHRGYIEKKLTINITGSETKEIITKVKWMPRSQTLIAVCTIEDLRIYDISKDLIIPLQVFKSLENDLTDMVVDGTTFLVSNSKGLLYRQTFAVYNEMRYLQETVSLNAYLEGGQKIHSIDWLDLHRLLFVNLTGRILIIRPDSEFQRSLNEICVDFSTDPNLSSHSCGISNILTIPSDDSLVCIGVSRKVSATPILLKISENKAVIHSLKKSSGYTDGICLYSQGNKNILLVQNDDGSLATHSILKEEDTVVSSLDLEAINNWFQLSYLPKSVKMPVSYFEKCIVLNGMRVWGAPGVNRNDVVLFGDPIAIFGSSKMALEKLSFDRNNENSGIVSSMLADPKTINITVALEGNSSSSLLLAGFKLFMETGSGSSIELFNRKITSILAQKRWYDVALCEAEILKGYLNKQITIKIHTPNPTRHPIRLYNFEIFAINQSGYSLEQKLGELGRIQSGFSSLQTLPVFYKQQSWKARFSMLENLSYKNLIVFLNALSCTSIQPCGDLLEIIARVSLQVFSSKVNVGIIALRQGLKALLQSMNHQEVYIGAKALVICWTLVNTTQPSEDCCKATLKALCKLSEISAGILSYVLKCYPQILEILNQILTPSSKIKCIEQYLNLLFAATELRCGPKAIEIYLQLFFSHCAQVKEVVISKSFAIIKKIGNFKVNFSGFDWQPIGDILYQLGQIFNIKDEHNCKNHTFELLRAIIEALCKDWSGELCRVNGVLSLLQKIMMHLEKLYIRKELVDSELFSIITGAVYREIFKVNCSDESQGRLFFLLFCNLLTSYSRPKEEKFSKVRKMHKSVVLAFVTTFPADILTIVSQQLKGMVDLFKSGRGSFQAVYQNEFLVEVSELNSVAKLTESEDPLLSSEWEGVLDSEIFEQPNDQFLVTNLLDFAYNLVSVSDIVLENEEKPNSFFHLSLDWKPLLLSIILEPSLHFVHSISEKLLERLCDNHFQFSTILNQAKIFHHFSVIQQASTRNNYFKQFLYIESIFLLKELLAIKNSIVAAEDSWKIISFAYIENSVFIETLIKIALNLSDKVSEECLGIVNSIFKVQDHSEQLENCVVVLWEGYLEAVVPNLISKLTLSGNAELSRQAAELISNLSTRASAGVCRKIKELMLHYLEILPNLGSNSYHFIMNFMKIAGNSLYSQDLREKFCQGVIRGLENSCKQLSSNVDNEIYEELQKLLSKYGFHWYLLEREPCLKCFDTNYTSLEQVKINDLQSEMRFSDSSYFVRFKNPIKVSRIDIKLSEIRGHKAVTGVSIYFCNQNNKDLADLKYTTAAWSLVKTLKVKPASTNNLDITLEIPTIMLNLMIKFETVAVIRLTQEDFPHFYQPRYITPRNRYSLLGSKKSDAKGDVVGISMGNDKELMTCPRCSKTVEDKFGICTCGENAYQCFKCRNINYESLDAFLCNECGEGRYCKVDIFLKYALDAICESVNTDKEVQELGKEVDSHLSIIQSYYENLPKYRENLNSFISKYKGVISCKELKEESGKELSPAVYSLISTVKEYQDAYYSMMISVKSVALLRTSIMHFSNSSSSVVSSQDLLTHCYGCNFNFVSNLLKGLKSLQNPELLNILIENYNIIETTVQYIVHSYSQKLKKKGKKLIIQLALLNPKAIQRLYSIVNCHLNTVIHFQSFIEASVLEEIHLILDFTCEYFSKKIDLSRPESALIWDQVLKEFWKIFFIVLKKSWQDSKVSNTLALFLDMILDMIFKTLILKNTEIRDLRLDEETLNFFLNNPALYKTQESETNSSKVFERALNSVGILTMYDDWQSGRVRFESWEIADGQRVRVPGNWLMDCLLYSSSVRVQDMSRMIILCLAGSGLWKDCLRLMLRMLPEALSICHQGADYYFTVLSRLLENCKTKRERILNTLLTETDKSVKSILAQQEKAHARGTFIVNISLGHGLACLLHMLTDLTDLWGRSLLNCKKFINLIISSFLNARKIQFVKNKVISESQEYLEKLFDHLHIDCSEEQRLNFLQECVRALVGCKNDLLAQIFLVQQVMRVIAPTKPEPLYYLRLEKSMTQEEFIRGNIEKNPYSSSEIGPLMADVRKRICKDLELADPDLLELLVAGQIVSPSLRIANVYEYVHWPHVKSANPKFANKRLKEFGPEELPQMMVTFRLAGLDGEATEDLVESLAGEEDIDIDLEQKYSITKILGQQVEGTTVIEYLLNLLTSTSCQELIDSTLNLLYFACQISTNRSLLCRIGGVPVFLTMLKTANSNMKLLKIIEILIADSDCQPYISSNSDSISLILNLLQSHKESLLEISPILPFLCHGNFEACTVLVNYFLSQVNLQDLKKLSSTSAQLVEKMLEPLPANHSTLRDAFLKAGVTKAICDQFLIIDSQADPEGTKFLLKVMKGLVRSHFHSQQLLNASIIEKIFKMKNNPNGIGPCAECLIESILQDREKASPAVADLLEIMILDEDGLRREKASKKKEEILKQFQVSSTFNMILEEEDGLTCVICKEGYKLRPDDLLGFYIYVSSVTQNTSSGDILHIMSSVTHFNPIHLQCHKEAARAEKSMRKPKTEWEGATIRNQHTKCNNWFPVWGPQIPKHDYAGGVQWMYSSYPTVDNRLCNEVYNLKILIEKFAYEESFSKESRGGGPEHNMQAIPYMLQLIYFLMEEDKGYLNFLISEQKEMMSKLLSFKPCSVMFVICTHLVCGSGEWGTNKLGLIRECWNVAKGNLRNEIKIQALVTGSECTSDQRMVLSTYKAFLIAIRIVDLIFSVLFCNTPDPAYIKSFLQSASADIQDRSLFIYEDYRKLISFQSIQDLLIHIGVTDFIPSWFS